MQINYKLSDNDLLIYESYKVHKKEMRPFLVKVKRTNPPCKVFYRSIFSLKMEWIVHNFCYLIDYERERTKDCDLDYPCDRPEWVYIIFGLLTWLFVW